jgi:hypothetical protein
MSRERLPKEFARDHLVAQAFYDPSEEVWVARLHLAFGPPSGRGACAVQRWPRTPARSSRLTARCNDRALAGAICLLILLAMILFGGFARWANREIVTRKPATWCEQFGPVSLEVILYPAADRVARKSNCNFSILLSNNKMDSTH